MVVYIYGTYGKLTFTVLTVIYKITVRTVKSVPYRTPYSAQAWSRAACVGLARTMYIRCIYGIFGREITTVLANPKHVPDQYPIIMCMISTPSSCVSRGMCPTYLHSHKLNSRQRPVREQAKWSLTQDLPPRLYRKNTHTQRSKF